MKRWALVWFWCLGIGLLAASVACPAPTPPAEKQGESTTEVTGETNKQDGGAGDSVTPQDSGPADAGPADNGPGDVGPGDTGPDIPPTPDLPPVTATPGTWSWVDVPGSKCGYGTQTGYGINPSKDENANRVFIYMQGGGACWKEGGLLGNCFGGNPSAVQLSGYDKVRFGRERTTNAFFFQRGSATNPFAKDHYVFIPYCTGDVFCGNSTLEGESKTMHFHGHVNMRLFLSQIAKTFPKVKEVIISGSSAGGFGSSLNWWLAQKVFGDQVKVHLLNDSGPPLKTQSNRWQTWVTAWNIVPPEGCTNCLEDQTKILDYYKKTLLANGRKMGFLSYDKDQVIRTFFGTNANDFQALLFGLYDDLDTVKNAQYFGLVGSQHTMLGNPSLKNESGVTLLQWINTMLKGDESWKSYRK